MSINHNYVKAVAQKEPQQEGFRSTLDIDPSDAILHIIFGDHDL